MIFNKPLILVLSAVLHSYAEKSDGFVNSFSFRYYYKISARGRLQETGGKKYFIAGKDKFILAPTSVSVPADATVEVQGIVNDKPDPLELKVLTVKPLPKTRQPAKYQPISPELPSCSS